jgi:hypothetical protein
MRQTEGNEMEADERLDDLLTGAKAIADFLSWSMSKTNHAIRKQTIPFGRMGTKSIIASKQTLREHFTKLAGSVPAPIL